MTATATLTRERPFVHERALCESQHVGAGSRIWEFAHVMEGARIGDDCNIGGGVFIETGASLGDGVIVKNHVLIWDGVTIEDHAFIGPAVVFTNDRQPRSRFLPEARRRYERRDTWLEPTLIRRGASLGAGAIIRCGVTVGRYAMVAAGALVTHDVQDYQLVVGSPARPSGWVCRCGTVMDGSLVCLDCRRSYQPIDGSIRLQRDGAPGLQGGYEV
ncbi:MAG: N-acetyltransferase [Phycisphaerales bacterium]|nr:MAG: N-acetyltransferase [Phycisphaerales bacterium]